MTTTQTSTSQLQEVILPLPIHLHEGSHFVSSMSLVESHNFFQTHHLLIISYYHQPTSCCLKQSHLKFQMSNILPHGQDHYKMSKIILAYTLTDSLPAKRKGCQQLLVTHSWIRVNLYIHSQIGEGEDKSEIYICQFTPITNHRPQQSCHICFNYLTYQVGFLISHESVPFCWKSLKVLTLWHVKGWHAALALLLPNVIFNTHRMSGKVSFQLT